MIIRNMIEDRAKENAEKGILHQISGYLTGNSGVADKKAVEELIPILNELLNDQFVLIMNYPIPGSDLEIPMLLVGPSGLHAIYPYSKRGIYRAKENIWHEMNSRSRAFEPSKTNLINLSIGIGIAVEKFLRPLQLISTDVEPVLMFSNPGIHVDTMRSHARMVLRDGIEQYANSLNHMPEIYTEEQVASIVRAIINPTLQEIRQKSTPESGQGLSLNFNFTPIQWVTLVVILLIWICILIGFGIFLFAF